MKSKITKIESTRNKDRVNVYVDEEYSFSASLEVVYKCKLHVDDEIELKEIQAIAEADNYHKGKDYALRIIEVYSKTKKEIIDKLKTKGYDKDTISKIIVFIEEYDLIDDNIYVERFIECKMKSQGKRMIKYNLLAKGIPEDIIVSRLALIEEAQEEDLAKGLALKKYNTLKKSETDKNKLYKKLGEFLTRKGYSHDIIKKVVSEILKEEFEAWS
ncbi:MAG TPA: recombination regulator RecX [Clostridiaceae bacterium]